MDDVDIQRHGLRPYLASTNCLFVKDTVKELKRWRDLMVDVVIGEHHTISGNIVCSGIFEPIAVGDNLEFQGLIYHIESVSHVCQISGGNKVFRSTVSLSHGMVADPPKYASLDTAQYPKVEPLPADPHVTVE